MKRRDPQDADRLLRLARAFPFVRVPEKLMLVREHPARESYHPKYQLQSLRSFYRLGLRSYLKRGLAHR